MKTGPRTWFRIAELGLLVLGLDREVDDRSGHVHRGHRVADLRGAERVARGAVDAEKRAEFNRRFAGDLPGGFDTAIDNFKKNVKFIKQVVDRFEKPDIIGGSQRRKPLRRTTKRHRQQRFTSVKRP